MALNLMFMNMYLVDEKQQMSLLLRILAKIKNHLRMIFAVHFYNVVFNRTLITNIHGIVRYN